MSRTFAIKTYFAAIVCAIAAIIASNFIAARVDSYRDPDPSAASIAAATIGPHVSAAAMPEIGHTYSAEPRRKRSADRIGGRSTRRQIGERWSGDPECVSPLAHDFDASTRGFRPLFALLVSKVPEALMSETERSQVRFKGKHPRQRITLPESEWVGNPQPHLRIVSDAIWKALQKRFAENVHATKGATVSRRSRSPIASLLRCECGGRIASWSSAPTKGDRQARRYTRLYCAWHRNRGPLVCSNTVMFRIEQVAGPLLAYVREKLLDPVRVQKAVDLVNAEVRKAAGADATRVKRQELEAEIARLDAEVGKLMELAIYAPAHAKAKLQERSQRLTEAQHELAALATPGPVRLLPTMTGEALRERLDHLWQDISDPEIDADKTRLGLEQLFGEILVGPLDGDWEKCWRLNLKTRPWALVLPRGEVVSEFGCGGRI